VKPLHYAKCSQKITANDRAADFWSNGWCHLLHGLSLDQRYGTLVLNIVDSHRLGRSWSDRKAKLRICASGKGSPKSGCRYTSQLAKCTVDQVANFSNFAHGKNVVRRCHDAFHAREPGLSVIVGKDQTLWVSEIRPGKGHRATTKLTQSSTYELRSSFQSRKPVNS
jgi:hypothetical protein